MRVTMREAVATSHTVYCEFDEDVQIKAQDGLAITSITEPGFPGAPFQSFCLSLAKGADIDVPSRLARRLMDLGYSKESYA